MRCLPVRWCGVMVFEKLEQILRMESYLSIGDCSSDRHVMTQLSRQTLPRQDEAQFVQELALMRDIHTNQ